MAHLHIPLGEGNINERLRLKARRSLSTRRWAGSGDAAAYGRWRFLLLVLVPWLLLLLLLALVPWLALELVP